MKNYQKQLLFFLMIFGFSSANSQNLSIGISGNIGLSQITGDFPISGDYKNKFTLSGNLGMFLEQKIGAKSALGIEVLWVQMEGKGVTKNKELTAFTGQGLEVIGVVSDKTTLHSSYLGIPLYYRFEIGKIGIKGGLQSMLFLFASSNFESKGEINGEPIETSSKTKDIKFERIDIGPKFGIDYRLTDAVRLRADYYHGLLDITSDEFPWERKNRQINLGVQYFFEGKNSK